MFVLVIVHVSATILYGMVVNFHGDQIFMDFVMLLIYNNNKFYIGMHND